LVKEEKPYWLGMGQELPKEGINYSGKWKEGNIDLSGKEIKPAHPNARYTVRLKDLANVDENLDNPNGVPISGIIYGGRDYDISPPVVESFSWEHGVFMGAILESITTATIVGSIGEMVHNPMANIDFVVVPLGKYIRNHLKFGESLKSQPKIFSTNYFLKDKGKFLNQKIDKKVWLMWMEGRIHGEYGAVETPVGFIPKYDDLKNLFQDILSRQYTKDEYIKAFSIRTSALLERLDRVEKIYNTEPDIPQDLFDELSAQRQRISIIQKVKGKLISPFDFLK
jgi:phosphoenolpyruvate carboxykinase (GTP)